MSFSPHFLFVLLICSKWCSSLFGPSVRWLALTEQSRAVLALYGLCLGEMLLFWNMHGFIVAREALWSLDQSPCVSRLDWYGEIQGAGESDVVEKGGSTSIISRLCTAPIHRRTWQEKSRWVQGMWTGQVSPEGQWGTQLSWCTLHPCYKLLSVAISWAVPVLCLLLLAKTPVVILLAVQAPEACSWRNMCSREEGCWEGTVRPGTCCRARAEMTSVARECREVRLGIVQRCRRHKRQSFSRVGGGSSSNLCELFPAIKLKSNEKLK